MTDHVRADDPTGSATTAPGAVDLDTEADRTPRLDRDGEHRAEAEPVGRFERWFGPLTMRRLVVLVVALAFLGGAVGYLIGHRSDRDPLSDTDVGFMQDMSAHHAQAVEMSQILLGKEDIDPALQSFAMEIILEQRYEIGIMNATLDRFGHPVRGGETVMGWMGQPVPADEMVGLASEDEMQQLREATGEDAEALWIALMSRHHLGGIHMADYEARHGSDDTTVNLAEAMVKTQRGEVLDMDRVRRRLGIPIPEGYSDPTQAPEMAPLSTTGD